MKKIIKTLAVLTAGVGAVALVKRASSKSNENRVIQGQGKIHLYKTGKPFFISK